MMALAGVLVPGASVAKVALAPYIDKAQQASCANTKNRLFLIDQKYVFWTRSGDCKGLKSADILFAAGSQTPLCQMHKQFTPVDEICSDKTLVPFFTQLIGATAPAGLHLRPDATFKVEEIAFLPMDGSGVQIDLIASAPASGVHSARTDVIRDEAAWNALWRQHTPNPSSPQPKVDFSKRMVLALFAGAEGGCSDLKVHRLAVNGKRMVLEYEKQSASHCGSNPSAPMKALSVARIDALVDFALIKPANIAYSDVAHRHSAAMARPANLLIKDPGAWKAFWASHWGSDPALPEIDFSKDMIIAVTGGPGKQTCQASDIDSIYRMRGRIAVNILHYTTRHCSASPTLPVHIVRLARSDEPVDYAHRVDSTTNPAHFRDN